MIRLVVGLGNPGKEYERTRHNAGFWLVERFASASGVVLRKDPKFKALVGRREGGAWLLLPQSFMNLSGQPVQMLAGFFKIKPDEILVVHDELDIACFPDDLPEFIEVDLGALAVGNSIHARELALPKGVEAMLHKDENPVVATVVVPALITEEEEAAAATAVAPSEIPTTEQAAPAKEGEAAAEGDKGAAKAEKPADKVEKKEKK